MMKEELTNASLSMSKDEKKTMIEEVVGWKKDDLLTEIGEDGHGG